MATATVVIALLATGHLLHEQGFDVGLDGLHERRGTGPTTVVTGTGVYRFLASPAAPATRSPTTLPGPSRLS